MRAGLTAVVVACALLVVGCVAGGPGRGASPEPTRPATVSVVPTETLAGGGARATTLTAGLLLVVEVPATRVPAGDPFPVRVTLTNTLSSPVHWDDFSLGWGAAVSSSTSLDGVGVGIGPGPPGRGPRPLTLAAGETTSLAQPLDRADAGVYRVYGAYTSVAVGPNGAPTSRSMVKTPEIVVTVR